jgi:hypothetical protein
VSESAEEGSAAARALAEADAAYERYLALSAGGGLDPSPKDEVVAMWRRHETLRRKMAAGEFPIIHQVERREIFWDHAAKSVRDFAQHLLRLRPGDAKARVNAAERLAARTLNDGQVLDPIFPSLAAAVSSGEISTDHARVITDLIDKLPHEVAAEHDREIEAELLGYARAFDPARLAILAARIRAHLDPDGSLGDHERAERARYFDLHRRGIGTGHLDGELTAEATEYLDTCLDVLAKPEPAEDGTPDPRTPGQRRHDALLQMMKLVMQAGLLPRAGGITSTILLHMDADTYATGQGTVTTGHGYGIPAELAQKWVNAGGVNAARIIAVLLSNTNRVEAYSSSHRIFTEQQRLAMIARDYGCTFPPCDAGPLWAQAHHVIEFQQSHRTTVDEGTLACGHSHTHFEAMGWQSIMINGVPWWKPPAWIDAEQRPIQHPRNHDP